MECEDVSIQQKEVGYHIGLSVPSKAGSKMPAKQTSKYETGVRILNALGFIFSLLSLSPSLSLALSRALSFL